MWRFPLWMPKCQRHLDYNGRVVIACPAISCTTERQRENKNSENSPNLLCGYTPAAQGRNVQWPNWSMDIVWKPMLEKGRSQTMDDGRIEILFLENGRNQLMIYYITTTNTVYDYLTLKKLLFGNFLLWGHIHAISFIRNGSFCSTSWDFTT